MDAALLGSEDYVRNCWYVAGRSEDFTGDLKALRLLEENLVVFRGDQDEPIALEDACPHRKLPLSKGSRSGSTIVCGYHGLTFDCTGRCVASPTQENAVPKRAVVRSYPVVDRYGFLWIWMGDADAANPKDIIDIPNFDNPTWGRTKRGAMEMACHYLYITDNLLDPSHVAWVHLTSFAGAGTDNRPLTMDDNDNGVVIWRWITAEPAPPYYKAMLPFGESCDRKQHYECRLPSTAINMSIYVPAGEGGPNMPLSPNAFVNVSYNFITPVDRENALYFWFQHRNMHADDEAVNEHMFNGAVMAFTEDKDILEEVQRGMDNRKTPYLNLGLDKGAMRFRKKVQDWIDAENA